MSWQDVTDFIGDAAPLVGKLLPIPGAGIVGDLLGSVFGTKSDPDAVLKAMKADPEWGLKVKKLELEHEARLAEMNLAASAAYLREVGGTMRAETQSQWWFQAAWRPYWGFISGTAFLILVIGVVSMAWYAVKNQDWELLEHIPNLVSAFAALFAVPMTILGVASWHRGMEKRVMAGEQKAPGILGRLVKTFKDT